MVFGYFTFVTDADGYFIDVDFVNLDFGCQYTAFLDLEYERGRDCPTEDE